MSLNSDWPTIDYDESEVADTPYKNDHSKYAVANATSSRAKILQWTLRAKVGQKFFDPRPPRKEERPCYQGLSSSGGRI
jgi:hypothetical protein